MNSSNRISQLMSSFQWGSCLTPDPELVDQHIDTSGSFSDDEFSIAIQSPQLSKEELNRQSRLAAYQELLLQMFGSNFECVPINGGFSGSSVVRIAPFDSVGNREESVIVKLDKGGNIRMEVAHSLQAHRALGDGAAHILGDPIFVTRNDIEYGAFKMELAGACWHIPEFVGGSMINTFRDIAVFESEERLLVDSGLFPERPYGSVDRVIKELFGQDKGPTRSLRRYEETPEGGDRRISKSVQVAGSDLLVGRLPQEILVCKEVEFFFSDIFAISDVSASIDNVLTSVRNALGLMSKDWKIIRGFCHGDLNGANILIDSMDGMWLIDFANAYKLPLTSDLAKFETCFLFEYCIVPIPTELFAKLATRTPTDVLSQWFRVSESVIVKLAQKIDSIACAVDLFELIDDICEDDPKVGLRLKARLYFQTDQQMTIDQLLLSVSHYVCESLVGGSSESSKCGSQADSFSHGVGQVLRMREYFFDDIRKSIWSNTSELYNYDVSNVELYVLLIREVSRIMKFRDVPPWIKFIALGYLKRLGSEIIGEINTLGLPKRIPKNFSSTCISPQRSLENDKLKYFKYFKTRYGHITDFISGKQMDVWSQCAEFRLRHVDTGELIDEHVWLQCQGSAYILQGIGGSGKSCFLQRLGIEQIVKSTGLIPIFVPPRMIDKDWLRVCFGDDIGQMEFLSSAIDSKTALLLFDDEIDEYDFLSESLNANRLVAISRKKIRSLSVNITPVEIIPMDPDQRDFILQTRNVVSVQFDVFFETFVKDNDSELVRSVGFLSLLICYWQNVFSPSSPPPLTSELHRQLTEPPTQTTMGTNPSVSDVYRVAVSVLVHRYLLSQETDRLLIRQANKRIMYLLRKIALQSKLLRHLKFETRDVLENFDMPSDMHSLWHQIAIDVIDGKFALLSVVDSMIFSFPMSGIHDFLVAEAMIHFDNLIALRPLLVEPDWCETLAILCERAPQKFIAMIELDENEDSILHVAARAGCVPVFQLFGMSKKVDSLIHIPNRDSMYPLHEAAKNGNATICRLLVDAKADVWQTTNLGWCPLHFAASSHNREVCLLLSDPSLLSPHQLPLLAHAGMELGKAVLDQNISSTEFLTKVKLVFPELSYFSGRSDTTPDASANVQLDPSEIELRRTLGAMLSVFYVCSDRYEEFVANQAFDGRLSRSSWARIRKWAVEKVQLVTPEAVDAMLSLMAVHDLGKLKDFRNDLAPDYKDHDAAMKYILQTTPEVLPSLCRLKVEYQELVQTTLTLDFNFGQFLQAENLPVNLLPISQLSSHGLAFYLFHIFADMSGIMGAISLHGSLFMTETMYINFSRGIDSLSLLSKESVANVYDDFLHSRELTQGLGDHQDPRTRRCLIRLACLSRIFNAREGADKLLVAFNNVPVTIRDILKDYLNRDGSNAFLIYYAPAFMENCKTNVKVGLAEALVFLARIFLAAEEIPWDNQDFVVIHISEAAELAKRSEFNSAVFFRIERSSGIRSQTEGTLKISPWYRGSTKREIEYYNHDYTSECGNRCVLAHKILLSLEYVSFRTLVQLEDSMSRRSWDEFQHWVQNSVLSTSEAVLAMFSLISIVDLGKICRLRDDLGISSSLSSDEARNEILSHHSYCVPSYTELGVEWQKKLQILCDKISTISISGIVVCEQRFQTCDDDFFLLASMLLAPSVLLTESGYQVTRLLPHQDEEGYLQYRLNLVGDTLGVFQPIVKLICLCSVFSPSGAASVWHAWRELCKSDQDKVLGLLNSDARFISGLSDLLTKSRRNSLASTLIDLVS